MANRAYLYSANKELTTLRDLSESVSEIPLVYKIILSIDTNLSDSQIWNNEHPIAIKGDFKRGLNRLYDFYEYLETQEEIDKGEISKFKKDTQDFFEENRERVSDLFFMEAGEVYDLVVDEEYTIEKENEYVYLTIKSISADISEILEKRPTNVFDFKEDYPWLNGIKENINTLSAYWTPVTYFSFNKT